MSNNNMCKFDFKKKKDKTIKSLKEVECFLNRASKCWQIGSIAKLFKK